MREIGVRRARSSPSGMSVMKVLATLNVNAAAIAAVMSRLGALISETHNKCALGLTRLERHESARPRLLNEVGASPLYGVMSIQRRRNFIHIAKNMASRGPGDAFVRGKM